MFIVYDNENGQAFGPYESEEAAKKDIIGQAKKNGWPEVVEAGDHPFEDTGLALMELMPPD